MRNTISDDEWERKLKANPPMHSGELPPALPVRVCAGG